jgi:hypothetical protein
MEVPSLEWLMELRDKDDMEAQMADETEKKTIKFQMMLAESEAAVIDDWGFSNRIRSRAEAIRRLCSLALTYDELSPGEISGLVLEQARTALQITDYIQKNEAALGKEHSAVLMSLCNKLIRQQVDLAEALRLPMLKSKAIKLSDDFDKALGEFQQIENILRQEIAENIARRAKIGQQDRLEASPERDME